MKAVILSIGDELIMGQTVDTNSAWLSARLADLGIMTHYHKTVADDTAAVTLALKEACDCCDLVIVTGGLGPTEDDLTRHALAELLNRPLDLHPPSLERIRSFFKSLGREMPAMNRIQAMIPRGVEVLANDWGTAPGMKVKSGKAQLFFFPGVPREMVKMVERDVLPLYQKHTGLALAVAALHVFGAGESTVAEMLGDLMRRDRNPLIGTTASKWVVTVRIRSEAPTPGLAQRQLAETVKTVEARLGTLIYGHDQDTLQGVVARLALAKNQKVVTAESCTGGLIAQLLTDEAGSSGFFAGGWVVYSNAMKTRELGVPASLIERDGAVSEAVACSMAEGALRRGEADWALSATGIAGPDGGSSEKPVGTVWVGLAHRSAEGIRVRAERFFLPGPRDSVRDRAAKSALNMLRLELLC
jgi:nicotinamide-nucleotide amidase